MNIRNFSIVFLFFSLILLNGCRGVSELLITPKVNSIPLGLQIQLKAEKIYVNDNVIDVTTSGDVTWNTSDPSIATVDENGLVSTKNIGEVKISATATFNGQQFKDSVQIDVIDAIITSVAVTPKDDSTSLGLTKAFTATAYFSDMTSADITNDSSTNWTSSDTDIATISNINDNKGIAKAESIGSSTITADVNMGGEVISDSATFNVLEPVAVSLEVIPNEQTVPKGLDEQFSAILHMSNSEDLDVTNNGSITWTSSDPNIATVSNITGSKGIITGVNKGSVTISASAQVNGQQIHATANLEVTKAIIIKLTVEPENESLPVGLSKQFKAIALMSDNQSLDVTKQGGIKWSSSNTNKATISNSWSDKGMATGINIGRTSITAFTEINGYEIRGSSDLIVSRAVIVSFDVTPKPSESLDTPQIPSNATKQFKAEVTMSDGQRNDVTKDKNLSWQSTHTSIATVSSKGLATGLDVGKTLITANFITDDGTFKDSSELTITLPHEIMLYINSDSSIDNIAGIQVEYTGYIESGMGGYDVIYGSEYLNNKVTQVYTGRILPLTSTSQATFFFSLSNNESILGALNYKAVFKWPDNSTTEGVLEWQFGRGYYTLTDITAIQNLLDYKWSFYMTVSNKQ